MFIKYLSVAILILIKTFCNELFATGLVQFKYDPVVFSQPEFDAIKSIPQHNLNDFIKRGIESNNQEKRLEENLVSSQVVVKNGTISHVQLLDSLPSLEAQNDGEVADIILKSSLYIYNSKCAPQSIPGEQCAAILSDIYLPNDNELTEKCEAVLKDRKSGTSFRRLLPRHYKDGFYKMFSDHLPQPLKISRELCANSANYGMESLDDDQRNLAVVQWSQFIENDLCKSVVTSMSNGMPIDCCNTQNYKLSPRYHHPACKALMSKDNTIRYSRETCLNYVRSSLTVGNKCTFAVPEQLNQATAKLDLSQLYGFTEDAQRHMRLHKKGLLKYTDMGKLQNSLLPMVTKDPHWFCALSQKLEMNSTCFMAGDSRVNRSPFAILIYTIMMRNHNRIANVLSFQHPDWEDEKLFQTAKLINIDIYQRIVFNEWLPVILGTPTANEINRIESKPSSDFNENIESTHQISNEYAVAASRFFLSMMPNELKNFAPEPNIESPIDDNKKQSIFALRKEIYSPSIEYTSDKMDKILFSLLRQQAMKIDASYEENLIADLENNKRPTHSDLLAFDIQRGRDHGIQPYFKYLEICNNTTINDWIDLERFIRPKDLKKLQKVYLSWRDIDLLVGGISEISMRNATVGPTFNCIIGEQFSKLRKWYQNEIDEYNEANLDLMKWKLMTAADLLCLNSNVHQVPLNIFKISSETNPMVNCTERLNKLLPDPIEVN